MIKNSIFLLGLFSILILQGCSSGVSDKIEPLKVIEAENQSINVYDTEGMLQYLEKEDNKVHVVNFWATWCLPCIKELPYFEQVAEEMGDDVELTLVSMDFEQQLETNLVSFVNKRDLQGDVIVVLAENEPEMMELVSPKWESGIPATVIYNKNKRIFKEGAISYKELVAEIEKFKL